MIRIRELSDLNDLVGFTVLVAPDRFPINGTFGPDQVKNLRTAFELINDGLSKRIRSRCAPRCKVVRGTCAEERYGLWP